MRALYYVVGLDRNADWSLDDYSIEGDPLYDRWPASDAAANAICSWDEHDSAIHWPCFDVDVPISEPVAALLDELFPQWVKIPSTTPDHWHIYQDQETTWDDYTQRLRRLVAAGVVEQGYLNAATTRGATFLRRPGVTK